MKWLDKHCVIFYRPLKQEVGAYQRPCTFVNGQKLLVYDLLLAISNEGQVALRGGHSVEFIQFGPHL